MNYLSAVAALCFVSGCATQSDVELKARVMGANIDLVKRQADVLQIPLLDATIPLGNGEVAHIVVARPLGGQGMRQLNMPDNPWARATDRAVGVLGTVGGIYFGGRASEAIIDATSNGIGRALGVRGAPTVVYQPAPVVVDPTVVDPPDPVVVDQHYPVIVDQHYPVIVDPVIVDPVIVDPVIVDPELVGE